MLRPQCERQIDFRPTLVYNAVTIPKIVLCPHFAAEGSHFCDRHSILLSQ